MSKTWQLQEAKNRLSKVVDEAEHGAFQFISRHGKLTVVLMSIQEFHRLKGNKKPLAQFLAESPLKEVDLKLERQKDTPRRIKL